MNYKSVVFKAVCTFILSLTGESVAAQANPAPYDSALVSKGSEVNLAFSTQRGIRDSDGTVYYISSNRKFVEAYSRSKLKWKTDVVAVCGNNVIGSRDIRYIRLDKNLIRVVVGKHTFVDINKATGIASFWGSD